MITTIFVHKFSILIEIDDYCIFAFKFVKESTQMNTQRISKAIKHKSQVVSLLQVTVQTCTILVFSSSKNCTLEL